MIYKLYLCMKKGLTEGTISNNINLHINQTLTKKLKFENWFSCNFS